MFGSPLLYSIGMAYSTKWWNSHSIKNWVELFSFHLFLNQIPKILSPNERLVFFHQKLPRRSSSSTLENERSSFPFRLQSSSSIRSFNDGRLLPLLKVVMQPIIPFLPMVAVTFLSRNITCKISYIHIYTNYNRENKLRKNKNGV